MAGLSDKFNGSKTKLLIGSDWADITTAGLADVADTADHISVSKIMDLGTISNEANVIDVPEFGQEYAGKLVGQLNAGTLDLTIAWNPGDTQHDDLKVALTNKTRHGFIIRWHDGGYGSDQTTAVAGREYKITALGGVTDWSAIGGSATASVGDVFTCTAASADLDTTLTASGATATEANADFVAFNAYISSFGIETTIDDAVKASVSLAIDGGLEFFA